MTDEDSHGHVYDILPICETCSLGTDLNNLKIEDGKAICFRCGKPMTVLIDYVGDSNFEQIPSRDEEEAETGGE